MSLTRIGLAYCMICHNVYIAIIVLSPYMPGFDPSLGPTWLYCYVHLTPGIHCDILHHFTAFLVPSVVSVCLLLDLLYSFNCMPVDHRLTPCCLPIAARNHPLTSLPCGVYCGRGIWCLVAGMARFDSSILILIWIFFVCLFVFLSLSVPIHRYFCQPPITHLHVYWLRALATQYKDINLVSIQTHVTSH